MQTSISVLLATFAVLSVAHPLNEPHKINLHKSPEAPTRTCADGWTHSNVTSKCYKLVKDVTILQALSQCHAMGAKLVSIHSAEENQWLADFVRPQSEMGSFFIGLARDDSHATWEWIDSSDFEYSNWYPGEPNNAGNDEDCVVEWTLDFDNRPTSVWNDVQCQTAVRDVVCEEGIEPLCSDGECALSSIRDLATSP